MIINYIKKIESDFKYFNTRLCFKNSADFTCLGTVLP